MRHLLCIIAGINALFGQTMNQVGSIQRIVVGGKYYEKNIIKSNCYNEMVALGFGNDVPNGQIFVDDKFVYRNFMTPAHQQIIQYGFKLETPVGPSWSWSTRLELPNNAMVLAATDLMVLMLVPEQKDGSKFLTVEALDFADSKTRVIAERRQQARLHAKAVVRDGEVFLIWSDGVIHRYVVSTSRFKVEATPELIQMFPNYIQEVVLGQGVREQQPPMIVGNPVLTSEGKIVFLLNLREKQKWTKEQLEEAWESSSPESRAYQVQAGRWPPKDWTFEGSDYILRMLEFDPVTSTLKPSPQDRWVEVSSESPILKAPILKDGLAIYGMDSQNRLTRFELTVCRGGDDVPLPAGRK